MSFAALRTAAAIARLEKQASWAGRTLEVIKGIPGVIQKGFTASGEEAAKLLGEGALGKAVGFGVKAAPTAAALYGAGTLASPYVTPWASSKIQQFQDAAIESAPYFDPMTQRYI